MLQNVTGISGPEGPGRALGGLEAFGAWNTEQVWPAPSGPDLTGHPTEASTQELGPSRAPGPGLRPALAGSQTQLLRSPASSGAPALGHRRAGGEGAIEEVAFQAGEEEGAGGADLGSAPPSTDDEQRLEAPERVSG